MSLASVALKGVNKSYGPVSVLSDITFTLGPHTRMGVIGRNGSGKSTLLRLIAGVHEPDGGTVTYMPPTAAVGYLPQESERRGETVFEFLQRRTGVAEASIEFERAAAALGEGTPEAYNAYDVALERFNSSGAADFDGRVAIALKNVGLDDAILGRSMIVLSGGQAAKASLASILLSRFDLLLLDEPTNDLDFRGLALLEEFVTRSELGMLIVSHDRAFVQRTMNSILEIDAHDHTAVEYRGGWDAFERERSASAEHAQERYDNYSSQKSDLKARAQQQRSWADKGVTQRKKNKKDNDKFIPNFFNDRTEKLAGKARATERAIERLEVVDKPWEGWQLQMKLPTTGRSGDVVARLSSAVVERGDFTLGPVDIEIGWAERVAITGPNGSGKTTLLNALLGKLPLASGTQYLGPGVITGELDQLRTVFDSDTNLSSVFMEQSGLDPAEAHSLLAKFDLSAEHARRQASSLSPGERTRALLALLMARKTNCLVLDEPTNHLDMEAIEQLESALGTYDGTVLLITHDRRMLEAVEITRTIDLA